MRKGESESVSDRKRNVAKKNKRGRKRQKNQIRRGEKEREEKCKGWLKGLEVGI